ncbi:VanZ family protein [Agromyces sp. MMS24-K17]|uniref:VanZ family protein n=1 Tax=Agromyces sp. MMS24-K17 TaxID=3372850 RepID=UPI0037544E9E
MSHPRPVHVARLLLAPYLVALGLIVFLPAREAGRVTGLVGVLADLVAGFGVPREPAAVVLEFVANIALFVPFGMLAALAWPGVSAWVPIVAGAAVSTTIELVQLGIPSRVSTVSDVVANTAGTALGVMLVAWWALRRPPRRPDRPAGAEPARARRAGSPSA